MLKFLITVVLALVSASGLAAVPEFTAPPQIRQNPNPAVPLAAIIDIQVQGASELTVTIDDGDWRRSHRFGISGASPQSIPLVGFRPGRAHTISLQLGSDTGDTVDWDSTLNFQTPALPTDRYQWPVFNVVKSEPALMEPGFTILSLRRHQHVRPQDRTKAQTRFVMDYGLLVGVNNLGEVIWYYQSQDRAAGIDKLENGNLIFHLASFETMEIDLLGNVINRWYAEKRPKGPSADPEAIAIKDMQTLHHQPHETKDGTFLSFSANSRVIENWYTNEFDPNPRKDQRVMGDTIIEFDKLGNIVWSWDSFDYLDTDIIGYEAFNPYWVTRGFPDTWDWSHGNGVSHDERDNSIVASFKLLDAVVKVDKATKDIKWIFGDHHGWKGDLKTKLLTPLGDGFRWPWHQHNPRWTEAGTLLVFNNNRAQAKPFDGREHATFKDTYSYTAEYAIDESTMTVREIWVSEPQMTETSCNSMAMSEAHRLPETDNILEFNAMCIRPKGRDIGWHVWDRSKRYLSEIPHGGRVREYSRTQPAKVLFELNFEDPSNVLSWQVYGGFRVPNLYWSEAH